MATLPSTPEVPAAHGKRSFWRRLSDQDRAAFAEVAKRQPYPAGAVLMRAGDVDRWVAVIWSGRVKVIGGGSGQVIATRGGGDLIGEQALVDGLPRSATLVAETPLTLLLFDSRTVTGLLARRAHLRQELTAILSERLREFDERLANRTGDSFTRIVRHLLDHVDEQAGPGGSPRTVPIGTQTLLGKRLGVSRDSVIRTFRRLRRDRIVTTGRGWVVVHDPERLRGLLTR